MLSLDQIEANKESLKSVFARFLDFDGTPPALMVDNAEWLLPLNYIEFLRDVGRHFSVNRMLAAESYKLRLEKGLSFIEFNYQILQAYDFLVLRRRYDCRLQIGGDDHGGHTRGGTEPMRRP